MKSIKCSFISGFLVCRVYSGGSLFMQSPMHSVKDIKDFIEQLYEDLKK
jgi:hypothetical protein